MCFRCPECKKTFSNKRARDGHIGGAHSRFKVDKVESVLEDLMKQKKQELVMKQMNKMINDDLPKSRDGIRIAIPPFTPKGIPNIYLPLKVILEVGVEIVGKK